MVQSGIVDHGINPYDVIQRAIDDTSTDYLLLRRKIDRDTQGNPTKLVNHPLYDYMEHTRECMVRYSTMAMQYDIQKRQLKLTEARTALLSYALKEVLTNLNLPPDQIKRVPQLLIEQMARTTPTIDAHKATALAEILSNDATIIIEDEPSQP